MDYQDFLIAHLKRTMSHASLEPLGKEPTEKVALFEARLHILTLRPDHDTQKHQAKASVV